MSEKTTVWMPYHEYLAEKEWLETMEPEAIQRMRYFFWNNFSHDGYEQWKLENDKQTSSITNKEPE